SSEHQAIGTGAKHAVGRARPAPAGGALAAARLWSTSNSGTRLRIIGGRTGSGAGGFEACGFELCVRWIIASAMGAGRCVTRRVMKRNEARGAARKCRV